ncbi:molybdopterin-dependent oxidoreductase [Actinomadura flavalba]|uniref:molybdopterin-dependent oxidoreductase n=1 Tax=Actinomadura flavalba TaxID=1120938 RepID=UPI000376AB29|nr:molybdopterin-dependent oxidoreductase [Actinomadura flavalba]
MSTVRTVCSYCGVGCGVVLDVAVDPATGRRSVRKATGDREHPANRGRLCTKGATTADMLAAPGRLTTALHRTSRGKEPAPLGVDAAIEHTAARLRAVVAEHGPDALAFYVSGQMTLEAQYLANKLAKGFVRTRHIESNSRLCMASAATGYKLSLGADGPPGSYDDFDAADLFLVTGANMADCHPILFLRMMERVKAGAKLVVVDPRRTATAAKADLHLPLRPGTDLALLNGLLHLLHAEGALDEAFVAAHTEGWDELPAFLADYPPARVAEITGVPEDDLRTAARWIAASGNWMSCWTMGLNQSTHGTWNTNALVNLHLATGAIGRRGSGPFSLTGQPNAMGGREMGYMGPGLPGQRSALVPADRAFTEDLWGLPPGTLRAEHSRGTVDMFERMAAGEIRACWIICTNPVASVGNRRTVIDGLQAADLVITQDVYAETETNAYADVVLPAAMWAEADGVMINSERNLTLARQAADPPGEALPDWEIIARVARAMGFGDAFAYTSAEEIFEEIKRAWNPVTGYDLRGVSYARLRETPVQWPAAPGSPDRNPIRYRSADGLRFPTPSGRAAFFARPHLPPAEMPDDAHPFVLNTGRVQHQWHTLTKTGRVARLNRLAPGPFLEIHPDDARGLGVVTGDRVEIVSRRGRAVLPAVVTDRVRPGCCFAPFHWSDLAGDDLSVNEVTSDAVDPLSAQPELKVCAVALRKVASAPAPVLEPEPETLDGRPISVLWASQTGTAEAFAERAAARLREAGWAPVLRAMDDAGRIPGRTALFVTSTFGDGDPPDNGTAFWAGLAGAGQVELDYAVCAFGDPGYADFCGHGRRLDERLAALGGVRIVQRADCPPGDPARPERWLDAVLAALGTPLESEAVADEQVLTAELVGNRVLGLPGSGREVREFTFAADGLAYEVGDALAVWPVNDPALVADWLAATGRDAAEPVTVDGDRLSLGDALATRRDIGRVTPELLRFVLDRTDDRTLKQLLRPGNTGELAKWTWGRQVPDVARSFVPALTAQEWVDALRPLAPRRYSISSSSRADPGRVRLTVSVVRYAGEDGRERGGVCSTFLADRAAGAPVRIAVRPSPHFRPPPDPDASMIMIGPGTGVAPFLGFLEERAAASAGGDAWLFFGAQRSATDHYYRDELAAYRRSGLLTRLDTAFSRDQRAKVYVQDRMREHGAHVWSWLRGGAHVYVCGDAARMAADVDLALREIVAQHGGVDAGAAEAYVKRMATEKRYVRDVY